jgi:thioredoxin 1
MQHRQQGFRAVQAVKVVRAIKRTTVLCAVLPLAAHIALAQGRAIYPDPAVAKTEIQNALQRAKAQHKRVILDFGGNWCGDCQVLDIYFHDPANKSLLEENFELVDVNIGRYDVNTDIADRYGIPLQKGVPALVILSPDGKVLLAQTHGEFESMRHLQSSDLTKFLNDWKPKRTGARGR